MVFVVSEREREQLYSIIAIVLHGCTLEDWMHCLCIYIVGGMCVCVCTGGAGRLLPHKVARVLPAGALAVGAGGRVVGVVDGGVLQQHVIISHVIVVVVELAPEHRLLEGRLLLKLGKVLLLRCLKLKLRLKLRLLVHLLLLLRSGVYGQLGVEGGHAAGVEREVAVAVSAHEQGGSGGQVSAEGANTLGSAAGEGRVGTAVRGQSRQGAPSSAAAPVLGCC